MTKEQHAALSSYLEINRSADAIENSLQSVGLWIRQESEEYAPNTVGGYLQTVFGEAQKIMESAMRITADFDEDFTYMDIVSEYSRRNDRSLLEEYIEKLYQFIETKKEETGWESPKL